MAGPPLSSSMPRTAHASSRQRIWRNSATREPFRDVGSEHHSEIRTDVAAEIDEDHIPAVTHRDYPTLDQFI